MRSTVVAFAKISLPLWKALDLPWVEIELPKYLCCYALGFMVGWITHMYIRLHFLKAWARSQRDMQTHTSSKFPKIRKTLPSFCGISSAREAYSNMKPICRTQRAPTFTFGVNSKACLLCCYFFMLVIMKGEGNKYHVLKFGYWILGRNFEITALLSSEMLSLGEVVRYGGISFFFTSVLAKTRQRSLKKLTLL